MTDTFDNALAKTTQLVTANDGKIYNAFDNLGTGVDAHQLAAWVDRRIPDFGGRNFGMALTLAMMIVTADRRTRSATTSGEGEWVRDAAWQERMAKLYADAGEGYVPTAWLKPPLQALLGREPAGDELEPRWHLSVAHEERIPTWDELVATAHELRPGVAFCVGVPPRSWWMNYDERVLHLWEVRDDALVASWKRSATGDAPT